MKNNEPNTSPISDAQRKKQFEIDLQNEIALYSMAMQFAFQSNTSIDAVRADEVWRKMLARMMTLRNDVRTRIIAELEKKERTLWQVKRGLFRTTFVGVNCRVKWSEEEMDFNIIRVQ